MGLLEGLLDLIGWAGAMFVGGFVGLMLVFVLDKVVMVFKTQGDFNEI